MLTSLLAVIWSSTEAVAGPGDKVNGRFAYTALTGGGIDIFLANSDGSNKVRLTYNTAGPSPHVTGNGSPSWSPDGTKIVHTYFDGTNRTLRIVTVDDGVDTEIPLPSNTYVASPAWSPDGATIAYVGSDGHDFEIFTVPLTGGVPVNVTNNETGDSAPSWSPDGSKLAYLGRGPQGSDIFTIPAAGGIPTQITHDHGDKGDVAWAPDGSSFAYQAKRDGRTDERSWEIFTVPSTGGAPTNLTDNDMPDLEPVWSPDGTKIAYQAVDGGVTNYSAYSFDIVTMPADGGPPTSITATPGKSEGGQAWGTAPDVSAVPSAPGKPTVSVDGDTATVSWSAPADGGSPIESYTVVGSNGAGSKTVAAPATSASFPGLVPGVYSFTVVATNEVGDSPASPRSDALPVVVPTSEPVVPSAPGKPTMIVSGDDVTVSWTAPADDGGAPILGYTVTAFPGAMSIATTATTASFRGLTPGTAYTFTVRAKNAAGAGPASSSAVAIPVVVLPPSSTGPQQMASPVAKAKKRKIVLTWAAPVDGGSPILGYRISSKKLGGPVQVPASQLRAAFKKLVPGRYKFVIAAYNAHGVGPASAKVKVRIR